MGAVARYGRVGRAPGRRLSPGRWPDCRLFWSITRRCCPSTALRKGLRIARKHLSWYCVGAHGATAFRDARKQIGGARARSKPRCAILPDSRRRDGKSAGGGVSAVEERASPPGAGARCVASLARSDPGDRPRRHRDIPLTPALKSFPDRRAPGSSGARWSISSPPTVRCTNWSTRPLAGVRSVVENRVRLETRRMAKTVVDAQCAPVDDGEGHVVLSITRVGFHAISITMTHQGAARSASGMAAMLMHEVKNPLSGIRGLRSCSTKPSAMMTVCSPV